ncbi:MAG: hemerythrin domain-containing protein [Nevskia sp.]|nr:hemerythrin domain-containing protein [Nevskia sp.]
MNIDRFKKDHAQILLQVGELRELAHLGVEQHAEDIAKQIVAMSSTIKLHLAAEDNVLYPALAKVSGSAAAVIGKRFHEEMGGIAAAYTDFAHKWNYAPSIAAHPDDFRKHANEIFKALHERIQKENHDLYPAAEAL